MGLRIFSVMQRLFLATHNGPKKVITNQLIISFISGQGLVASHCTWNIPRERQILAKLSNICSLEFVGFPFMLFIYENSVGTYFLGNWLLLKNCTKTSFL